jgi:hypothetical protein
MADYRDYAAEERGEKARKEQEERTGFSRNRFTMDPPCCLACGCSVGSEIIHRKICKWPVVEGKH